MGTVRKKGNTMEEKIIAALDNIRPFLQRDGGDVEFVELTEDNVVKVKLQGHCAGCPHAQMTIKQGIERLLKEQYPEITAVESV
jgi:Fe-S cluster biogenesis protein NfuA